MRYLQLYTSVVTHCRPMTWKLSLRNTWLNPHGKMPGTDENPRQILTGNFQPIRNLDSANRSIRSREFVEIFLSIPSEGNDESQI